MPTIAATRKKIAAAKATLKTLEDKARKDARAKAIPRLKKTRDAFYSTFGEIVHARRKKLGMSQEYLASEIGLTRQSVCNIEAGRQAILVHHLYLFADALGCDPRALLPKAVK